MDVERERWSGEGDFTEQLLAWLAEQDDIVFLRVEDAVATRAEVDYNFISNEIYVRFRTRERQERRRLWGVIPVRRTVAEKAMTMQSSRPPWPTTRSWVSRDYADEGMIQYLHTQRVIPPYQTRGYKLIELVRIYEVDAAPRS